MEYRYLGASGVKVSPICLGTMMFGGRTDARMANRIIDHARSHGVNFIDTADVYVKGKTEQVVGRAIKRDRDAWVLATKAGNPMTANPNHRGLGAKWLTEALDASLKRLGTDYVDVFYFHLDDMDTPMEESLETVANLIRQGKTRYFGLSNYRGWRLSLICATAEAMGVPAPIVCQPYYNAMDRTPERDILPACEHFGLGVVPYSPMARGVLTGKYDPKKRPRKDSRAGVGDRRMLQTDYRKESLIISQKLVKYAEKRGMTAAQYACAWVLANPLVTSLLAGPRTMKQWQDYMSALDYMDQWTAADEAFMDKHVTPGHPSTPGYNDPKYPIQGRPVGE